MKKQFLFVITLIVVYTSSYSQSQLNHWYISPKKMDMSLSPPIPSTISPTFGGVSAATVVQVANGMYDKAGNLIQRTLENGAVLRLDDKDLGQGLRFSTCLAQGCLLPISFPTVATDAMKAGKALTVAALNLSNNEPVSFNVSLTGFGAALDRIAQIDK